MKDCYFLLFKRVCMYKFGGNHLEVDVQNMEIECPIQNTTIWMEIDHQQATNQSGTI